MASPLTKALDPAQATAAAPGQVPIARHAQFRKIFDQHAALVWRALRHLGVRESDIADQCQEVFVVVFRRYDSFEGRSTLDTWIYGICLRVASEYRRRAHVRREVVQDDVDSGAVEPAQLQELERRRARQRFQALLDTLDEPQRQVFVLYEIEGVDMKRIAELLECPLQTAYSRLRLARAAITAAYQTAKAEEG